MTTVDGTAASACVALNTAHHPTVQQTTTAVAAYGGRAIAAKMACQRLWDIEPRRRVTRFVKALQHAGARTTTDRA